METKRFTVSFSVEFDACDAHHAASKASDLIRSKQPIALTVVKGRDRKHPITVVPNLEEHLGLTLKKFLPGAEVEIENEDDVISITVISDLFCDFPNEESRITLVSGMITGLPDEMTSEFLWSCYTPKEFADYYEHEDANEPLTGEIIEEEIEDGFLSGAERKWVEQAADELGVDPLEMIEQMKARLEVMEDRSEQPGGEAAGRRPKEDDDRSHLEAVYTERYSPASAKYSR